MTKRFIVTCSVLGGATVLLAIVGSVAGIPLVEWKMRAMGATQVIVQSPSEPAGIQLATALMFAWPAVSTIAAVAIHRWRRRIDPSILAVIAYFTIPVIPLAGYIALRTSQLAELVQGEMQIRPMLSLGSLGPGSEEAMLVGFVSACLWLFLGTRKPAKF